jgi:hypothetical protein
VQGKTAGPVRSARLAGFADVLDRFLLLLVVVSTAILATLAVLVFCTGASLTFTEIAAIRAASGRLILVLAATTVTCRRWRG